MRCLLVLALFVLVPPMESHAGDPIEEGRVRDAQAQIERIEALVEAGKAAQLREVYKELAELHNKIQSSTARRRIQKAIGDIAKSRKHATVLRVDAVGALAQLFDADGAWKQLERLLPEVKEEAVDQLGLAVLDATARLAPDGAQKDLERLVAKAKDLKAAGKAVEALGHYGYARKRVKVLTFLIEEVRSMQPRSKRGRVGKERRERFRALSASFIKALNQLTGRAYRSVEIWLDRYDSASEDLDALFTRRLAK